MSVPQKNWLEWAVFSIGLALVVSVLAYLTYDALTLGDTPPTMEVQVGQAVQQLEQVLVPITVTNRGEQPAEGVLVEVVRKADQQHAQFEIAFLPRGATGEGWAAFEASADTPGEYSARVIGFERP
jgi:uncharacterized protein (TIGR02588 family)